MVSSYTQRWCSISTSSLAPLQNIVSLSIKNLRVTLLFLFFTFSFLTHRQQRSLISLSRTALVSAKNIAARTLLRWEGSMVNFDLKYAMSLLWSEVNSFTGKNSTQISFLTYPEKSTNVLTNTNPNLSSRAFYW